MKYLLWLVALALAVPVALWEPVARAADEPKKDDKKPKPAAGADVFGHDKVWQLHFELTAAEYAGMQPTVLGGFGGFGGFPKGPMPPKVEPKPGEPVRETHRGAFDTQFPWAEASFTADGKTVAKIGLRYKGNSTYFSTMRGLKRSLKVDLDRFDDGARFHGLKSLNLHCGVMDPSKSREALAYAVYRAAGVPAPRTAFAEVTLTVPGKYDKEFVGVYTLTESVDKNFLKAHYANNSGLLMKPERVRSLDFLGNDWARYKDNYQPKRDATKDESDRVIAFVRLVNQGTEAQFNKEIADYLDVDAFLRYMAATSVVSNLDSFFTNGHNYCLYLHPETKKFHFIPWDTDLSLGNFNIFGSVDEQADLSITKPYQMCRLADRVMANKATAEKYKKIVAEVTKTAFNKEKVFADIATLEKTAKPLLEKERKAVSARREFAAPGGASGATPPDLRAFVEKRLTSVAAQLDGKGTGYAPVMRGFGGMQPPSQPQRPGDIFGAQVQTQLRLTDEQKKKLAELQKQVDKELDELLTPEQREQLKRLRSGPMGGFPKLP
jgi:spore coat protein H